VKGVRQQHALRGAFNNPNAVIQASHFLLFRDGQEAPINHIYTYRNVLWENLNKIVAAGNRIEYVGTKFVHAIDVLTLDMVTESGARIGVPPSKEDLQVEMLATNATAGSW
jgi:hypothetical protein